MADYTLDWSAAGANGVFDIVSPDNTSNVDISTTSTATGQTAAVGITGAPDEEALWVSGLTEAVTTTIAFGDAVENVAFEIYDLDAYVGSWDDQVTIVALDADGNEVPVVFSNLDGLHTVTDGQVDADGNASTNVETSGAPDSVTVSIAGPISTLKIIFNHGESIDSSGVIGISDLEFDAAPDFIVEGTAGDDLIDIYYTGDPEDDMVDASDAADGSDDDLIMAGAGDDTIRAGDGNDTVYGEDGMDSLEAGAGNDVFYGGAGDDWVNGDLGDDVLYGGAGDDFLRGSYGFDTIYSGEGNDFLWGGYNDDLFIFSNNFGNDTVDAENEQEINGDTLDLSRITDDLTVDMTSAFNGWGTFNDGTSFAEWLDVEHVILGSGVDTIVLADYSGADAVEGFSGPTDNGDGTFTGHDMLDVTAMTSDWGTTPVNTDDVVVTDDGNGNAVLTFPVGDNLTLVGVSPSELSTPAALNAIGIPYPPIDGIVEGTSGNDIIDIDYVGDPEGDRVDNNDAILSGEVGDDDIVHAGLGDDFVESGAGNDEVLGGAGDDSIGGGAGDDHLSGEDGEDCISGDGGDDTIIGGDAADKIFGGDDADLIIGATTGDYVDGGEGGDDNDTLDLSGLGPLVVTYDADNGENGMVKFTDGAGNITGTMRFENIENVVPCFTPGMMISTPQGERLVEELQVGDRVITRDNGVQIIRWVGHKFIAAQSLQVNPHLRPIVVRKGALGENLPDRDLVLSPNHRIWASSEQAALYLGESEVLLSAKHLINDHSIRRLNPETVRYIHFMFDRHELVMSNQSWTESFQPGDLSLGAIDAEQRSEIFAIFPELMTRDGIDAYLSSRKVLKRHEALLLRS